MGTYFSIKIHTTHKSKMYFIIKETYTILKNTDNLMSTYKDTSQISYINKYAHLKNVKIHPDMYHILSDSIKLYHNTNKYFNIFLYPISKNWGLKGAKSLANFNNASYKKYYQASEVQLSQKKVFFLNPYIQIDLGGIAKGYAIDKIIHNIKTKQWKHHVICADINFGGQTYLFYNKRSKPCDLNKMEYAIAHSQVKLSIPTFGSFSTTSSKEQSRKIGSKKISHIINPKTFKPLFLSKQRYKSVTVFSKKALLADALSTAFFLMPIKKANIILEKYPDVGVIWIKQNESTFCPRSNTENTCTDSKNICYKNISILQKNTCADSKK